MEGMLLLYCIATLIANFLTCGLHFMICFTQTRRNYGGTPLLVTTCHSSNWLFFFSSVYICGRKYSTFDSMLLSLLSVVVLLEYLEIVITLFAYNLFWIHSMLALSHCHYRFAAFIIHTTCQLFASEQGHVASLTV